MSMLDDLLSARALGPTDEERELRRLLADPAVADAPMSFWREAIAPLSRLCEGDAGGRQAVRSLYPEIKQGQWLDVLEKSGALVDDDTDPEWLLRLLRLDGRDPRVLAYAERLAPALAERGATHWITSGHDADWDVLDALIAGGVAVSFAPRSNRQFHVSEWMGTRRRALAAVLAHPELGPIAREAVWHHATDRRWDRDFELLRLPSTRAALKERLRELVDSLDVPLLHVHACGRARREANIFFASSDPELVELAGRVAARCRALPRLADTLTLETGVAVDVAAQEAELEQLLQAGRIYRTGGWLNGPRRDTATEKALAAARGPLEALGVEGDRERDHELVRLAESAHGLETGLSDVTPLDMTPLPHEALAGLGIRFAIHDLANAAQQLGIGPRHFLDHERGSGFVRLVGRRAALLAAAAAPGRSLEDIEALAHVAERLRPFDAVRAYRFATPSPDIAGTSALHGGWVLRDATDSGPFVDGAGVTHEPLEVLEPEGPAGDIGPAFDALAAQVREQGPRPFARAAAEELAEGTGLSYAEAVLVVTGRCGFTDVPALPADLRRETGLGTQQVEAARTAFARIDWPLLLARRVGADPVAFATGGPDVPTLIATVRSILGSDPTPADLKEHRPQWVDPTRLKELFEETAATPDHLEAALWAAETLPRDHPARPALADAVEMLWMRIMDGTWPVFVSSRERDEVAALPGITVRDNKVLLNPATATPRLMELLWTAPVFVLAGTLPEIVDDLRTPGTGDSRDPRAVVPDLVDEVSADLGLSADAAAYLLLLLTHPDPRDAFVKGLMGWKPKAFKAAGEELETRGLVVRDKRPRTGRTLFLPGGWKDSGKDYPAIEAWKVPVWGWNGSMITRPIRPLVAMRPWPALFRETWTRWQSGDRP